MPGAGKSTLAKHLSENDAYPIFSIDSYFTNSKGDYDFKFDENHKAYKACEQQTEETLKQNKTKVFVDNTFTLDWELEPYFKLAEKYKYQLHIVTVENYHNSGNIHKVGDEQLQKMAEKYKIKLV